MISDDLLTRATGDLREQTLREFPDIPNGEEHVFSDAFEENMQRLIRRERRSPRSNMRTFARRAAAVVLVVFLGTFTCILGVDAWREQLFHMVERKFDEYSDIRYEPVESSVSGDPNGSASDVESASPSRSVAYNLVERRPAYIPNGYILTSQILGHGINWSIYEATDESGNFSFNQSNIGTVGSSIDTEGSKLTPFKLKNGDDAFKMSNRGAQFVLWNDDRYEYMIVMNGGRLNEAVKIAESVELCPPDAPHPPKLYMQFGSLPYSEKQSIESGNVVIGANGNIYGIDRINSFFTDYENKRQTTFFITDFTKGNPFPTEVYFDGIRVNVTVDETKLYKNPGEGQVGKYYKKIERTENAGVTIVTLIWEDDSRIELLRYPSAM